MSTVPPPVRTTRTAGPDPRHPAVRSAAWCWDCARGRTAWPLAPAVIAGAMAVVGPVLYGAWSLFELPAAIPGIAAGVAGFFARAEARMRRQGWPRACAYAGFASAIGWTWWVWQWGPSSTAYDVLGWCLVAEWPLWLYHRGFRERARFEQDAPNHWSLRRGVKDPGFDRIATWFRGVRKQLAHRRNAAAHRLAQGWRAREWHRVATGHTTRSGRVPRGAVRTTWEDGDRAVLAALARQGHAVSPTELARAMGAKYETVRQHLVSLAADGRVDVVGPEHRRRYRSPAPPA